MSHSSDVETAVIALLAADATLAALLPDGVWYDTAPFGSTAFAIVAALDHADSYVLHGSAAERFLFLVKAVRQDSSDGAAAVAIEQAEQRIYVLLQDAHDTQRLAPPGYRTLLCHRTNYVRYTDLDEEVDQRWLHRGGHFEVLVAPIAQ